MELSNTDITQIYKEYVTFWGVCSCSMCSPHLLVTGYEPSLVCNCNPPSQGKLQAN